MVLSIVSCVLPIFFVNHHSSHPCIVHLYTVLAKISFIPISLHKLAHISRVRARWRALFTSKGAKRFQRVEALEENTVTKHGSSYPKIGSAHRREEAPMGAKGPSP